MPNEPPLTQLGRALVTVEELKGTVSALERTIADERANSRRFKWTIRLLIGMGVLILFGIWRIVVIGGDVRDSARESSRAAKSAAVTAAKIDDCLIPGGACAARLAQQGISGTVRQMVYQECYSVVRPEERTHALFVGCRQKALAPVIDIEEAPK